ncbi:MAG: NADH-quinone oxidoreductase subunit NuoE [Gammaproteobacteria bacterium]|nr:NADH-quinone oxidoreductase subunit NuoE [Gammaproteobacteria bacterium]
MSSDKKINLLNTESRAEIDKWVAKYPQGQQQSALMSALRIAQDQNGGWLTDALMDAIAEYLQLDPIAVYEVATFYSMYELQPVGKHKICVCTNISCQLCGSDDVVAHLKKRLRIGFGDTTIDGRFTLKEVECLGACSGAPMLQVGNDYYENLTPDKLDELLEKLD